MNTNHNPGNLTDGFRRFVDEVEVLDPATQRRLLVEVGRMLDAQRLLDERAVDEATARRLAAQIRLGRRAMHRLICSNMRLVIWVARRAHRRQRVLELDDLVQEGVGGLTRAIEKYDLSYGTALSTYATWWIRQAVDRAIMNAGLVRIPVHVQDGTTSDPTTQRCARRFDSIESIEALTSDFESRGTEAVIADDGDWCEVDSDLPILAVVDDPSEAIDARATVATLLRTLTPREATILARRSGIDGDPMTLEQIGRDLGLTRERVRQIEHKALEKSRAALG